MYFEEGKCCFCGKKLPEHFRSPVLFPYNQEFSGPHFCSDRCYEECAWNKYHNGKHLEPIPPAPYGDEPLVLHEGEMKYYGPNGGRELYLQHHAESERERIAYNTKQMTWQREDFIRTWTDENNTLKKKKAQEEADVLYAVPTMPDEIPYRIRFEHTHVLAGSGAGKTTLLTHMFMDDVFDPRRPSLIVLDGKGTWAPALQRFACFAPGQEQSERLIIINPQDTENPAALNMFALPRTLPKKSREVMRSSISENLAYIFESRKFDLSAKQDTAFSYAAKVIFSMPDSTITDLRALMQDPLADRVKGGISPTSRFKPYIEQLEDGDRQFMEDMFYHPSEYMETRRQIQNRIYNLRDSKPFARMFEQTENRLDMFDVMQTGKILIIDSSTGAVGEKTASTFGKYIISLALSTARARINLPRSEWHPTFLYIDEAQMFADEERTQPLLQQAREFNLGVILSHQKLLDLTPKLRATFAGNTSSKYCAKPSHDDARDMAKEMRTNAEFIMAQKNFHFAAYIRGMTDTAVSKSPSVGTIEQAFTMTKAQYAELMRRNNARMSPRPPAPRPSAPAPRAPQLPKTPPMEESDDFT